MTPIIAISHDHLKGFFLQEGMEKYKCLKCGCITFVRKDGVYECFRCKSKVEYNP